MNRTPEPRAHVTTGRGASTGPHHTECFAAASLCTVRSCSRTARALARLGVDDARLAARHYRAAEAGRVTIGRFPVDARRRF